MFTGLMLETDRPARMTILHPLTRKPIAPRTADNETGEPAWVELYSLDSARVRAHEERTANDMLAARRQVGRAQLTPSEIEEGGLDLLAVVVCGWRLLNLDGSAPAEPFPCTPENVRGLLRLPGMRWLREQIDAFLADRANFAKPSSTS